MPTSAPDCMSEVCKTIIKLRPRSALDLGAGFGKYGVLLREYMDHWWGRVEPQDWEARVDAVEVFPRYVTDLYYTVYSNVYLTDIRSFLADKARESFTYDLCYFGDVIEHFPKQEAWEVLGKIPAKYVLVQTPNFDTNPNRGALHGNEAERHLSRFYPEDFQRSGAKILCSGRLLLVLVDKEAWKCG